MNQAANAAPLLLASASPRRRELLRRVGLPFEATSVAIDEAPLRGERGAACALRLARAKAAAAAALRPGRHVLAADTVVVVGRKVLGKPRDAAEARAMIELLADRWHDVVTGVALRAPDGAEWCEAARTRVRFAPVADDEIERYVSGAEPYDKAGGYALHGAAGWFVEEIRGSASNVVGLPLEVVRRLAAAAGLAGPALDGR